MDYSNRLSDIIRFGDISAGSLLILVGINMDNTEVKNIYLNGDIQYRCGKCNRVFIVNEKFNQPKICPNCEKLVKSNRLLMRIYDGMAKC